MRGAIDAAAGRCKCYSVRVPRRRDLTVPLAQCRDCPVADQPNPPLHVTPGVVPPLLPCRHLGPETGKLLPCRGCRGLVRLKEFACAKHGTTTLALCTDRGCYEPLPAVSED